MATVVTTFEPKAKSFPYSGLPSVVQDRTALPRGELKYSITAGAIALAGTGNDRRVSVICRPPVNFAYVVAEFSAVIFGASGAACGFTTGYGEIPFYDAGANQVRSIVTPVTSTSTDPLIGFPQLNQFYTPFQVNEVLLPLTGEEFYYHVQFFDDTVAGVAATINFNVRFLQYDVTQAHHVEVNAPQLVR